MRISTNSFFENSSSRLTELQSQISASSDQITSGRKFINPSDDPVAAAKIIGVQQSQSINTQLGKNITTVQNNLGLVETILSSMVDNLLGIHDQILSAGSASIANGNQPSISLNLTSDKVAISSNLQALYDQLLSLANSTDASGNYLFAGQKPNTAAFVKNADQESIVTSDGLLGKYQVSNGVTFTVTIPNTTLLNASGKLLTEGSILIAGQSFYIAQTPAIEASTPGDLPVVLATPATFAGAPAGTSIATKDFFEYKGSSSQSQIQVNSSRQMSASILGSDMFSGGDLFNKLQAAITALNMPSDTNPISIQTSALSDLSNSFNTAFSAVSNAQTSVGTRLSSLDNLKSTNNSIDLQFTQTLSGLQDTDYNKAVSDLARQQFILQAAQKTFAQIGKSSLFDFIS